MNQRGVTLVELLIVIVVLGIISAISVPAIGRVIERTENDAVVASLVNIERAIYLRSLAVEGPVPQPTNPGTMTNAQWAAYSDAVFGDYIQGAWPSPAFGGYFVYREYLGNNQSNRWFNIDSNGALPSINASNSLRTIEGLTGSNIPESYVMLMLRFDDCDSTKRAVTVLINSDFADRLYQYVATDGTKNVCAVGDNAILGENTLGVYVRP